MRSLLPHVTPMIDAAVHNEDTIVMWTFTNQCHEIGQRGIDKCY